MPAVLSLQWSVPGRHVATEHDACAWESWLSLGFPLRVPACTSSHWFKYQRLLTPCIKTNTKNTPVHAQAYTNSCRSEGPLNCGLAPFCMPITHMKLEQPNTTNWQTSHPANTGLRHSTRGNTNTNTSSNIYSNTFVSVHLLTRGAGHVPSLSSQYINPLDRWNLNSNTYLVSLKLPPPICPYMVIRPDYHQCQTLQSLDYNIIYPVKVTIINGTHSKPYYIRIYNNTCLLYTSDAADE